MGFPFVWRKTAEAEAAMWKERAEQQRKRAESAERTAKTAVANRRTIAELYAALCDSHGLPVPADPNQPDRGRAEKAMARFDQAQARRAADRIARLQKGVAKARTEAAAQKRRADRLQGDLDNALGLNTGAVALGASWQDRREHHLRYDKTAEEATP